MKEFYQSPEFLNAVAACTIALIGILFIIGMHPFKKKKRVVPSAQWTASSYYMYLKALILSCTAIDQLPKVKALVEGFYDRNFLEPITRVDRKRYYARLLEEISRKEMQLLKRRVATA